ncbi:APC family permease [Haloquadratum walsbyi]|jgi:Amino acid transporters|uniref:Amino acid transporter n=1 Tax=Haloquadratum walsbyi J07HQW2 TaxID=1238425 RepID=U1PUR5_9EURY|nr:APC family permease [Haloquadratum walsbyi]ERG96126.1 MAG: amino acid transporter [Haloquadratum walsbyi J07HQW2]
MSQGTREPTAELGLLDATMIGMGAMIGAGIFVLTGLAAEISGPAALLVFVLNGVVTAFTGLSYAELAASIPKSGGGYAFVREIFDDRSSFILGWMLWFAYMIAGALYALGFAPNFIELLHVYGFTPKPGSVGAIALPLSSIDIPVQLGLAFAAVTLLVVVNAISTAASGSAETFFTITKVIILLIFILFGFLSVGGGEPTSFTFQNFNPLFPDDSSALSILPAMGLTFIAFEGYDLITTVTEEVENPRENIPKAIFLSLAATVIIYALVVTVAIGTLGASGLAQAGEAGIANAATSFMPTGLPIIQNGGALIVFGAVFSTLTALNAVVIASSRVAFAMGREGQLIGSIGNLHHRFGTPFVAIIVSGVVMLLSVVLPTVSAGYMSSLFFLLSFVIVNFSVIKLRRERPDMTRPYKIPYYPAPPIIGIILNVLLTGVLVFYLIQNDQLALILSAGWITLGFIAYYGLNWLRSRSSATPSGGDGGGGTSGGPSDPTSGPGPSPDPDSDPTPTSDPVDAAVTDTDSSLSGDTDTQDSPAHTTAQEEI